MRVIQCVLATGLLLGLMSACATPVSDPGPWGGLSPDDAHHLAEGSSIKVSYDDVSAVRVRVADGHLYLDDQDLGAYEKSQAVHFRRDGVLTVDGQVRGRVPTPLE